MDRRRELLRRTIVCLFPDKMENAVSCYCLVATKRLSARGPEIDRPVSSIEDKRGETGRGRVERGAKHKKKIIVMDQRQDGPVL